MARGVYQRPASRATPKVTRTLRPGDALPSGEPRRYADRAGYIRLRWRVGVNQYVEILEHRLILAARDDREVHHIDRNRANNAPENLLRVTREEHAAIHAQERRKVNVPLAIAMYRNGLSTVQIGDRMGVDPSNVYRSLVPTGVLRTEREAGALRRTVDGAEVLRLHALGLNATQIARLLGVVPDAARGALSRNGIRGRAGQPTLAMRELEESLRVA